MSPTEFTAYGGLGFWIWGFRVLGVRVEGLGFIVAV